MKHLTIFAVLFLVISGCVSVEELARQDLGTIAEHKRIFVECKGKRFAFKEWLEKKKKHLLTKYEISTKSTHTYAKCLEEKLGVMFWDQVPTTSLDIFSKTTLRFYTGGDHTLQRYFERVRKWQRVIHEGGEPWKGFWHEHNEVIDKWRAIYKD